MSLLGSKGRLCQVRNEEVIPMTKPTQPFRLKAGRKTVFTGTRSACMTWAKKKGGKYGELALEPNKKFGWIRR